MGIELIKWPGRAACLGNVGITAALFSQGSWVAGLILSLVTVILAVLIERI